MNSPQSPSLFTRARRFLFALLALPALGTPALADLTAHWDALFLVPGEETTLFLMNTDGEPIRLEKEPVVPGASIRADRGGTTRAPGGESVYIQLFRVKADKPGMLALPPIDVQVNGRAERLAIPPIHVSSTASIRWYDAPFPYGVLWYASNLEPYVNENVRAGFKLFLPEGSVAPVPPLLTKDGIAAEHFQSAGNIVEQPSVVHLRQRNWAITNFGGDIAAIREGDATLAGKIPVSFRVTSSPRAGFVFSQERTDTLLLPPLELKALPLPPQAPTGYDNAVGQFSVTAKTDAKSLSMNEPVAVELTVRGQGNLAQITCPVPVDAKGWKLYPATREVHDNLLREIQSVTFRLLMRPTAETSAIPSFALSYFDPAASEYKTAETAPIALEWEATPAAGTGMAATAVEPPPAGEVPIATMTDIYGPVPQEALRRGFDVPLWLLSIFYIPAFALLLRWVWKRWKSHREATAARREREHALALIGKQADDAGFLKGLGAFVETHVPASAMTPPLHDILRRRDEEVFRPEAQARLAAGERRSMLQTVRQAVSRLAVLAALALLGLSLPTSNADAASDAPETPAAPADDAAKIAPAPALAAGVAGAEEAYRHGQYSRAVELASSAKPTDAYALYLAGNAQYRLDNPGLAALAYARALAIDPEFAEAKANLAFIQRKEGAILPDENALPPWLSFFTYRQLAVTLILAGAVLATCLVLLLLARRRKHIALTVVTVAAAVVFAAAAAGIVSYLIHGDDLPEMAEPGELYYAVRATAARNAADAASAPVVQLPPSTPVRAIAVRGSWVYVETYRHTRGWVPARDLELIGPQTQAGFSYLQG